MRVRGIKGVWWGRIFKFCLTSSVLSANNFLRTSLHVYALMKSLREGKPHEKSARR